jgi:hypothetical protein
MALNRWYGYTTDGGSKSYSQFGGNGSNSQEHLKMKKIYLLTLLLLAVGVSGARAQDVRYNFAQGEDFSKSKTYNWVSIKNADQVDELTAMFVSDSSLPLLSIVRSNHMSLSNTSAHALTI